jgi:hypothetical protein
MVFFSIVFYWRFEPERYFRVFVIFNILILFDISMD